MSYCNSENEEGLYTPLPEEDNYPNILFSSLQSSSSNYKEDTNTPENNSESNTWDILPSVLNLPSLVDNKDKTIDKYKIYNSYPQIPFYKLDGNIRNSEGINDQKRDNIVNEFINTSNVGLKNNQQNILHNTNKGDNEKVNITYSVISNNSNDGVEQIGVMHEVCHKEEESEQTTEIEPITNRKLSNFRRLLLYGEKAKCNMCNKQIDKNALFIYKQKYICLECSIKFVENITDLSDWEVTPHYESTKDCYRCNCKRSKRRFMIGKRLCAYCVLKKKYVYGCKKYIKICLFSI